MLYFDKQFAKGLNGVNHQAQFKHITGNRQAFNTHQRNLGRLHGNSPAVIPQDVYKEFDNQTKAVMRANNQTLLNDLLPLAKSLPVGKVEHVVREASDAGVVTSSLSGQTPADLDKSDYDYASTIKVIHQSGFGREWMELEGQRSEGFDGLVDDQANVTRKVLDKMADHMYDGVDITFKGTEAVGIKNSSRVQAIDLDATDLNVNFDTSTTPATIRSKWIDMIDKLRVTNNVEQDMTFYISAEIESNFQQFYGTAAGLSGKTVMQTLKELPGVADIKMDRSLDDNEVVFGVLSSEFIRPLVGMAMTTVPIMRQNPFDNYNFIVWTNIGLEIKTDYSGKTGWAYARDIA